MYVGTRVSLICAHACRPDGKSLMVVLHFPWKGGNGANSLNKAHSKGFVVNAGETVQLRGGFVPF